MANTWRDIQFGVQLTDRIGQYLELLGSYSYQSQWQDEGVLRRAVYRYENYWLPLAADYKSPDLEPPRDVHWVWHLHMLKPRQYHSYCMEKYQRVVPHRIRNSASEEKFAKERTALIWKDKYLSEPYELESDLKESMATSGRSRYSKAGGVLELITGATFQSTFLYQVSLPHYKDKEFRQQALKRYKKFLYLWSMKAHSFNIEVVPYDLQLLWRIHVLHPMEYFRDIEFLTRGKEALLDLDDLASFESRLELDPYQDFYQEPLIMGGTGFRGYMVCDVETFPKEFMTPQKVDICDIIINDLTISDIWSGEKNFLVEVKRLGDSSFSYTSIFTHQGQVGKTITSSNSEKGLGAVTFDSRYHRGLEFHIFGRKGKLCFRKEKHIATVFYNPRDAFSDGSFFTRTISANLPKITVTDPSIKFIADIKATEKEATLLSMHRDNFEMREIPGSLRQYIDQQGVWDTVHSEEGDLPIIAARHALKAKKGNMAFGVEVVKCDAIDLGAVMLYLNNDRLVAVAHSIGPEHLPTEDQVSSQCPLSMDPENGDKAMLIRNSGGDWAILVGKWIADSHGAIDGKVSLTLYNLKSKTTETFEMRDDEMQTLSLGYVKVDMPTGKISLSAACDTIAESVTIAFCAGILFLACQKRAIQAPTASMNGSVSSVDKLSNQNKYSQKQKMMKKRTRKRKMSASFTFLLAVGLQMDSYYYSGSTPTSRSSTLGRQDNPTVQYQAGDIQFMGNMTNSRSYESTPAGSQRSARSQDSRNLQKMDFLSTKSGMGAALSSLPANMNNGGHYVRNGTTAPNQHKYVVPSVNAQPSGGMREEDYQFPDGSVMDIRL